MTIAIIIALLLIAACMGFMAYKLIQFEAHESKADQVDKYAQRSVQISNGNFKALKDELERVGMQTTKNTDEITEIIDRMQKVIDDIARLDHQAVVDHANLVDIRKRYVNYRPKAEINTNWAKDCKCFDDMTIDEKIEELGKRADTYLNLMSSGKSADIGKYQPMYMECMEQMSELIKQENNDA